jgi:uncharacterized protein
VPSTTSARRYPYGDGPFHLDHVMRWAIGISADQGARSRREKLRLARPRNQDRMVDVAARHLPLIAADAAATGETNPVVQRWLGTPPDDPYWERMDQRAGVPQVTAPTLHLTGWYDINLRAQLAEYAAQVAAGHAPFLTVGPW